MTGLLADPAINPLGKGHSLWVQAGGVAVTVAWTAVVTAAILLVCRWTTGLRVTPDDEAEGLDSALHGEALHEH